MINMKHKHFIGHLSLMTAWIRYYVYCFLIVNREKHFFFHCYSNFRPFFMLIVRDDPTYIYVLHSLFLFPKVQYCQPVDIDKQYFPKLYEI